MVKSEDLIMVCGDCESADLEPWKDYHGVEYHQCNKCGKVRTHLKFRLREDYDKND